MVVLNVGQFDDMMTNSMSILRLFYPFW